MSQPEVPTGGMPILSGPPPLVESSSCRQCGRDFNPIWRRSKACGHCGYEYCTSCLSDGHALMPRRAGDTQRSSGGAFSEIRDAFLGSQQQATPGYDVEPVCTHCLGMLQVTAAPLATLRTLPIKRLKEYIKAYDIKAVGVKEKEDVVQAVIRARSPTTGCLLPEYESFYRRKSVPREGRLPSQQPPPPQAPPYQPRQRPQRPPPPHQNYYPRPPPPQPQARPAPGPQPQARPPPPQPQPAARPPPAARTPTPPVPTILSLVALPKSYLSSLSIGTLKAILYDNHVRVDFKQVLEKNEVIDRVHELIEDERRRLERQRKAEEREAAEAAAAAEAARRAEQVAGEGEAGSLQVPIPNGGDGEANGTASLPPGSPAVGSPDASTVPTPTPRPGPTGPAPEMDRGLCVVCQDEEATLAVVDCGHLAMCQHCSDLIMATSKECPLCRTRIVTAQRLIRIYRV